MGQNNDPTKGVFLCLFVCLFVCLSVWAAGLAQAHGIQYHHSDHLGSTGIVTDNNREVVEQTLYSPFGELLQEVVIARDPALAGDRSNLPTNHLFTSQELDHESNLHYYGARYDDSILSRFLSRDPILSEPPYAYVRNNPIRWFDSTGQSPEDPVLKLTREICQLARNAQAGVPGAEEQLQAARHALERALDPHLEIGEVPPEPMLESEMPFSGTSLDHAQYLADQIHSMLSQPTIPEALAGIPERLAELQNLISDGAITNDGVIELIRLKNIAWWFVGMPGDSGMISVDSIDPLPGFGISEDLAGMPPLTSLDNDPLLEQLPGHGMTPSIPTRNITPSTPTMPGTLPFPVTELPSWGQLIYASGVLLAPILGPEILPQPSAVLAPAVP
ncbi:MAG: RHS repeat-associated core domain-containing protein [Deltaproteobacteria bacterium]|nr:RHS repeat-associated core domain-containing protein [Deltaproteobacteria bacterium]